MNEVNKAKRLDPSEHVWIQTYRVQRVTNADGRNGIQLGPIVVIRGQYDPIEERKRFYRPCSCLEAMDSEGRLVMFFEGVGIELSTEVAIAGRNYEVLANGFLPTDDLRFSATPQFLTRTPQAARIALEKKHFETPGRLVPRQGAKPSSIYSGYEESDSERRYAEDVAKVQAEWRQIEERRYGKPLRNPGGFN